MSIVGTQTAKKRSDSRRPTRASGGTGRAGSGPGKCELQCPPETLVRGPARSLACAHKARRRAYGLAALPVGAPSDPFETAERITALKGAIREHCRLCMNGDRRLVRECTSDACALWVFRMGTAPRRSGSRVKAIRAFCLMCCGGPDVPERYREVEMCSAGRCPLGPWGTGRRLPECYLDRPGAESREPGTVRRAAGSSSCDTSRPSRELAQSAREPIGNSMEENGHDGT